MDAKILEKISPKLEGQLRHYCLKLTNDKNDADDLYQSVILRLLQSDSEYNEQGQFSSYIFRMVKNNFINEYRKKVRRRKFLKPVDDLPTDTETSFNAVASSLMMEEIWQALNTLPRESRLVLHWRFQGYDYGEIAEMMDKPIGTVKSKIFMARQKLAEKLKAGGYFMAA